MATINAATIQVSLTARDAGWERQTRRAGQQAKKLGTTSRKAAASVDKVGRSARKSGSSVQRYSRQTKTAARSTDLLSRSARRLGGALALAFGFRALVRGSKKLLELGTTAEETASKYETVFGSATSNVDRYLKENAVNMGLTTVQGQELTATMGAIFQGFGASEIVAAGFAKQIVTLGADLASFNNIGTEDAINRIRGGITGLTVPLKKLGIVFSVVDAQQLAMTQTGKTSAAQLTKLEVASASLTLITRLAGRAIGDVDRTAGSTANVIKRLQAAFGNMANDIAREVLPVFGSLFTALDDNRDKFTEAAASVSRALRTVIEAAGEDFGDTAFLVGGFIGAKLGEGIFAGLGKAFREANPLATEFATGRFAGFFDKINAGAFASEFASKKAGDAAAYYAEQLGHVARGSDAAFRRAERLREETEALALAWLTGVAPPVKIEPLEPLTAAEIQALVSKGLKGFKVPLLFDYSQLGRSLESLRSQFGGGADGGFFDPVKVPASLTFDEDGFLDSASLAKQVGLTKERIADILNKKEKDDSIKRAAFGIGEDLVYGIIQGSLSVVDILKRFIAQLAARYILGPLAKALDILSPSKATADMGRNLGLGFVVGMDRMQPAVRAAAVALGAAALVGLPGQALAFSSSLESTSNVIASIEQPAPQIVVDMTGVSLFQDPATESRTRGSQEFIREGFRVARDGGFR